ncbi:MAG: Abi family protein [Candidatus Omnitrophica bacterium]|nr:Abi family protein [Candidatus Omnitrophota bacterium]
MEKYNKPPLSYDKQINLLASRGLIIANPSKSEKFLSQVSYYRFSAYCLPFELKRHQFHSGVTFERIQQLYEFDRRLRFLIDEALEVIEISVRSTISYYLARKYGAFVHEDAKIFFDKSKHAEWITKIHDETVRSKETFIDHYKNKYEEFPHLPLWMAVEVMSFGSLSQLYHNLLRDDQIALAQIIGYHSTVVSSWLHTFTYIRNICAHHSRIWNRELAIAMVVPKHDGWHDINTKRVGSVVFAVNNFLSKLPIEQRIRDEWHFEVNSLLSQPVAIPNFYEVMGFLNNWKESPLWKSGK